MRGRLIVKKLQKVQKNAPKNASEGLIPVFTVFFIVNVPKGGDFGVSSARVRCPLEYKLSVGERFWNFFFPENPKKNPTLFTTSLLKTADSGAARLEVAFST